MTDNMHKLSRTYAGKNKLLTTKDASNLHLAASKDLDIFKKNATELGYSEIEIDKAIDKLHSLNRQDGLY